MQTEIEKFDQINQYLKGQLSEDARILFEAEIGVDAQLRSEIEMHRLLNETIVDNYLIDVKQKTKAVLQQKKTQQNKKNWTIGLGSIILVGTIFVAYNQFNEKNTTTQISLISQKIQTTKPSETQPSQTTPKVQARPKESLNLMKEPTKPNYITKEPFFENPIETEIIPKSNTEVHSTASSDQVKAENSHQKPEESNSTNPTISEKIVEKPEKLEEVKSKEDIQLILNMSRNELVALPMEEGFDGDFLVFDQNGNVVFQNVIRNGFPNHWDGYGISGQVASGQYGFVLKSKNGQTINPGYITVVR